MPLVAGVDSSTQSTKVLIIDTETAQIVRQGKAPHPNGTEVDPQAWLDALRAAITAAGGLDDISGIAVGGQQHGLVALDAAGEVIRPALLWNDTKSAPAARALTEEFGREFWAQATGSVPVASLTVTKLRYLADAEPENAARIRAICLPHDWLTWKLSGSTDLRDLATDRSDASGTGYVDCTTDAYRYDILAAALRIPESAAREIILPRIAAPFETVGNLDAQWLSSKTAARTIPIGPGAGDNAGAALGLGLRGGQASLSIGTSGVIATVSDHPVQDATSGVTGFSDANGQWLPLACTLNGSLIQDYFRSILDVSFEQLGELAESATPGAGGITLIPYFLGERTPNLPGARAHLGGLTATNFTRANLARAAYEGLACLMRGALEALRVGGITIDNAMLIGGGAQSRVLVQILADVLEIPLALPEPGEYVAKGAAYQAARVAGLDCPADAWAPRITARFTPRPGNPAWPAYQALARTLENVGS